MGWIWFVRCEKSRCHFVARIFALIAPVHPVLHRVSCSYKMIPNAPKYYEGPMGWIGCVRFEKSRCYFVARTFALIAPVQPISHRVSCRNETIQNAPKYYKTHQFMSLVSNGVDRVCSLRKTLMRFRGTNFFINCTVQPILHRVSCSDETNPKCTQTVRKKNT